jgi:hypothetical protein
MDALNIPIPVLLQDDWTVPVMKQRMNLLRGVAQNLTEILTDIIQMIRFFKTVSMVAT